MNKFTVGYNLTRNILCAEQHEALKKYLCEHHVPNHVGNSSRGIGDIYELELVRTYDEEHADDIDATLEDLITQRGGELAYTALGEIGNAGLTHFEIA